MILIYGKKIVKQIFHYNYGCEIDRFFASYCTFKFGLLLKLRIYWKRSNLTFRV